MLIWIFGDVKESKVAAHTTDTAAGTLLLENASVEWFLSINENNLPAAKKEEGKRTHRSLIIDGEAIEFNDGFTELHTTSYQQILGGKGFRIAETIKTIQLLHDIRNCYKAPN